MSFQRRYETLQRMLKGEDLLDDDKDAGKARRMMKIRQMPFGSSILVAYLCGYVTDQEAQYLWKEYERRQGADRKNWFAAMCNQRGIISIDDLDL